MSERMMSQAQYEREWRKVMVTSTSGISGLTGGNCTREEHAHYQRLEAIMSERFMTQQQYHDTERISPHDNLAAELQTIAKRLDYVLAHAGGKLDAPELHELCQASIALDELVAALKA